MDQIKKKILILGANGQVGKELCIYLKNFENCNLIASTRNNLSAYFLISHNINCVIGDIYNNEILKREIETSDLIFDLAAPSGGNLSEIKKFYKNRLNYLFNYLSKENIFVFASTMMAWGMSELSPKLKYHIFPGTMYAIHKRYAEKYCIKLGKRKNVKVFIFRLADVHGVLQRTTNNLKKLIENENKFILPTTTPAWIVFVYEIAESLIRILENKEKPGIYTLTSKENWEWYELLNFIGKRTKKEIFFSKNIEKQSNNKIFEFFKIFFFNYFWKRKDFIRANLPISPNFEKNQKLKYYISQIKTETKNLEFRPEYKGLIRFKGVLPGKKIENLTMTKKRIREIEEKIFKILNEAKY